MTNGLFNDIFVQAEIDYRHDRAVTGSHRSTRPYRSRHHVRWPRHGETARRHAQAVAH
jgi:hypothetical protein